MIIIKRRFTLVAIVMCLCMGMLYGQDNISGTIKIKGIDDIARERSPELFLPQDEFETNAEYNQRVARKETLLKDIRVQLLAETKARKKEKGRLSAERAVEEERLLQIKIAESLAPAEFTPSALGSYDAENNTFPFKINWKSYTVNVPRSEARDFKKEFSSVKVEGYKQLKRDLITYDYFNMVAIHPITGSRFPFGPTKDLAAAPVIASKKSVVPPDLSMRVAFVEPNGNGFLDAEEKGKVKVSISNSGKGSAMGVFVKLDAETSNRDISAGTSKIIGEIPAGQTKTTEFEINASKSVTRMENRFTSPPRRATAFRLIRLRSVLRRFPLFRLDWNWWTLASARPMKGTRSVPRLPRKSKRECRTGDRGLRRMCSSALICPRVFILHRIAGRTILFHP